MGSGTRAQQRLPGLSGACSARPPRAGKLSTASERSSLPVHTNPTRNEKNAAPETAPKRRRMGLVLPECV